MTDAQFEAWLADLAAERIVLCELDHAGGTEYVASHPYISLPGDIDPNRVYDDRLAEAVDIETRVDGLTRFGEISLTDDGALSRWVQRAWQGHEIRLYLGGPDWSRNDFRLHARGINNGIASARRGELTFEMIDQSARLDEAIDTGSLPDDAGPVPLALGSIYNAPAFRTSTTTLEYTASYLPCTALTPKDLGNDAVPFTGDLANGTFTLDNYTPSDLTVDIEEAHNTPVAIAQWVADRYGLSVSEATLPAYTVGLYYSGQVTGRQILDDLCAGLGAYWFLDPLNQLVVRQHVAPTAVDLTLFADDIDDGQIELSEVRPPWKALTLRWGRNYAPLSQVAGTVQDNAPSEAVRLQREWSESTAAQAIADYPLAESVTRDSCIANAADAATERDRLLELRRVRHDVWSIDAYLAPVAIGQGIGVEHERLAGVLGRVISVSRSPTRSLTTLEVWV